MKKLTRDQMIEKMIVLAGNWDIDTIGVQRHVWKGETMTREEIWNMIRYWDDDKTERTVGLLKLKEASDIILAGRDAQIEYIVNKVLGDGGEV